MQQRGVSVDLHDREPGFLQQFMPLLDGALHGSQRRHHGQVQLRRLPVHARVRKHHFVDQDAGVLVHGWDDVLQDRDADVVGVVVQDVAHVIELGAWKVVSNDGER